jgi:hypothetical protein
VKDINLYLSSLYQASGRADKLGVFYKREAEIFEKRFGKKDARASVSQDQLADHGRRNPGAVLASPASLTEGR